jgi:hypothetical protein
LLGAPLFRRGSGVHLPPSNGIRKRLLSIESRLPAHAGEFPYRRNQCPGRDRAEFAAGGRCCLAAAPEALLKQLI